MEIWFPGAEWVGTKAGKKWVGTTNPIVVLHTLEFLGWPNPEKWDAPSHLVCNPWTNEIRQYVRMDKAAYSVRDNPLEDDYPTWQVELWGKAAFVPKYNDEWYRGVASLCKTFNKVYDIPLNFADFSIMQGGEYAPQRLTDESVRLFTGFLGHGHMGRGVDEHWDPGKLDVPRLERFLEEEGSMWANDITDKTWMTMFHSGVPGIVGYGRYYCSNDGTYDWPPEQPWGSNPHHVAPDGAASYDEKVHALNVLLQGFSVAAGSV